MLREVALRRALEDGRNRRQRELEDVQERGRALRRRLRELTDRMTALGTVHGRFAVPEAPRPEEVARPVEAPSLPETATQPSGVETVGPTFTLTPVRREEEVHAPLLQVLATRFPEGFTAGQMREVLDETEPGRPHSYDAAWTMANALSRTRAIEIVGTRSGPTGASIRVYRVPPSIAAPAKGGM